MEIGLTIFSVIVSAILGLFVGVFIVAILIFLVTIAWCFIEDYIIKPIDNWKARKRK